jgi:hypothetical protein
MSRKIRYSLLGLVPLLALGLGPVSATVAQADTDDQAVVLQTDVAPDASVASPEPSPLPEPEAPEAETSTAPVIPLPKPFDLGSFISSLFDFVFQVIRNILDSLFNPWPSIEPTPSVSPSGPNCYIPPECRLPWAICTLECRLDPGLVPTEVG